MLKTVSTQLALASDTLPEVLAKGNTTGGTDLAVSSGDDITFADNSKAIFGAGSDLSIHSDGATGQVTGNVTVTGAAIFSGIVAVEDVTQANLYVRDTAGRSLLLQGPSATLPAIVGTSTNHNLTLQAGTSPGGANSMLFNTAGSNRLTIDSTGAATFSDNIIIGTSGKGIDFSATAGTGTSELLDDYEEGTWTPTLEAETGAFASITYDAVTSARYTKIGNVVHVQGYLLTDAVNITGASNGVLIGNFPFVAVANTSGKLDGYSGFSITQVADWTTNNPSGLEMAPNTSKAYLYYRAASNGGAAAMLVSFVNGGADNNRLSFAGTYISI